MKNSSDDVSYSTSSTLGLQQTWQLQCSFAGVLRIRPRRWRSTRRNLRIGIPQFCIRELSLNIASHSGGQARLPYNGKFQLFDPEAS